MKRGVVYSYYKKELSSEHFVIGNVSSLSMGGQRKGLYSLLSVYFLSPVNLGIIRETDHIFSAATQNTLVSRPPPSQWFCCLFFLSSFFFFFFFNLEGFT